MNFTEWRHSRPFWGSVIAIISGSLILWVPLNLFLSAFLPGSIAVVGLLFGGLIIVLGLLSLFFPQSAKVLGIIIMFLSVLSVIGALGGLFIGTILGLIGGAALLAWRPIEWKDDRHPASQPRETAKAG
ncbi:DUF6114 domain-containing protein [Falsibacillus pallidus]|uniref:Uncharacterized protein n=1 Tax=Falsibacillus pallidus TaxID=493781 RepID=A0A370FYT8_9BACI|nr:DUF6114 domain-containing protein [Falsibacillus pallidus]RDI36658.1 hypothetical protein DFR59_12712 [Falsibacillus pallidus]